VADRDRIESVIQRLRNGAITPAEATGQLLAAEQTETLASLLQRLGTPPPDIINHWCTQMRGIASAYEQEHLQPLPEIDLDQWSLTAGGELLLGGRKYAVAENDSHASQTSLDRIQAFADQWAAAPLVRTVVPGNGSVVEPPVSVPKAKVSRPPRPAAPADDSPDLSNIASKLRIAAVAVGVIAVGVVIYRVSRSQNDQLADRGSIDARMNEGPSDADITNSRDEISLDAVGPESVIGQVGQDEFSDLSMLQAGSKTDNQSSQTATSSEAVPDQRQSTADGLITLKTLESLSARSAKQKSRDLSISLDEVPSPLDMLESIDSATLLPGPAGDERAATTTGRQPSAEERSSEPANSAAADEPESGSESRDAEAAAVPPKPAIEQLDIDQPPPHESPQPTRQAPVLAVDVGQPEEHSTPITLAERPLQQPQLDFSLELPVELIQEPDQPLWRVRDVRKEVELASIESSATAANWLWSQSATDSPLSSNLIHGRISDGDTTIFLRPQIDTDPWSFDLSNRDVMPTWDLGYPLPPHAGRIEVDFRLPEGLEYAWIEPIEATEPKRTRGLAAIKPEGNEDIALGVLLNIRCTRKLSARVRFGARLGPQSTWSLISRPALDQFAQQTSIKAAMVETQAERLADAYRQHTQPSQRKVIRKRQEHHEQILEKFSNLMQRISELQTMLASLESGGAIKFRLWVQWPDRDQEILVTGEFSN